MLLLPIATPLKIPSYKRILTVGNGKMLKDVNNFFNLLFYLMDCLELFHHKIFQLSKFHFNKLFMTEGKRMTTRCMYVLYIYCGHTGKCEM